MQMPDARELFSSELFGSPEDFPVVSFDAHSVWTSGVGVNRFEDKIAWLAYFNAGIRVVDLSDPYNLKELGYYIPKTNKNSYPISQGQPVVIQINEVDLDPRGLAYVSDRVGAGLFILQHTGPRTRSRF